MHFFGCFGVNFAEKKDGVRQNPRVDEGFSLKRETCRSSDVEAVFVSKWLGSRSSEKPVVQATLR
ncbi:hypothetical protein Lalb_Chr20g0111961 [Lupinus albus]|uniref:Uncharacterized protein n=1 Tax=Lupinus albus TaxID=3870 RepID=A0A6A4NU13_LUPAL|nr:hypothetical protein Lalb_Chr20g0111961 [Lupinus albus]